MADGNPTAFHLAGKQLRDLWQDLPPAYARKLSDHIRDASFEPLLAAYLADPENDQRFHAVTEAALPIAVYLAYREYKRHAWRWQNPSPDDVVQDAVVELIVSLRDWGCKTIANANRQGLFRYVAGRVAHAVRDGQRRGRPGAYATRRKLIMRRIRKRFVRVNGRLPTKEEAYEQLRALFSNPNIQIGDGGVDDMLKPSRCRTFSVLSMSASDDIHRDAHAVADERCPSPTRWIDASTDAVELAEAALDDEGREILRRTLAGESQASIGVWLGISEGTARKRVNAVLWQLRTRADLAESLGVKPAVQPSIKVGKTTLNRTRKKPGKRSKISGLEPQTLSEFHLAAMKPGATVRQLIDWLKVRGMTITRPAVSRYVANLKIETPSRRAG
ncbi:helix-turn-helix domain-containing protein [Humisphaera borealis]|uniref:Uncharacterized protein n=1 Tax=Humisphaera borealis TaxID=2807512 RepID=A0A7M2WSJ2_9BACT|nr:hypothetical protein [Humisphaera borealis]QOV88436.1 hypothetical protein IPV69_19600 [Humisphaera borealis]